MRPRGCRPQEASTVAAWSVGEALAEGRRALSSRSATAGLDAQMLLAETIGAPSETCWHTRMSL